MRKSPVHSTPAPSASQEAVEGITEPRLSRNGRWKHSSLPIATLLQLNDSELLECCRKHPQGAAVMRHHSHVSGSSQRGPYVGTRHRSVSLFTTFFIGTSFRIGG